jgi:hypothetical protein
VNSRHSTTYSLGIISLSSAFECCPEKYAIALELMTGSGSSGSDINESKCVENGKQEGNIQLW